MNDLSTHAQLLAGGVVSIFPPGRLVVRGQGGRVCDDRGSTYIDMILGYGAVVIGHGEPTVTEAVAAQAQQGTLLPGRTREEQKVRESLHDLFPHTFGASFHKTGSEAVAAAMRIARAATGHPLIVRCGFHGWHDEMIQIHRQWHGSKPPGSAPPLSVSGVRDGRPPIEWLDGNSDSLETILASNRGQVAAVVIDPVQLRG
ncbi:MAG: aminotransferase class III-fold pyridoxal phosphate-dependent enzyme, partial [Verrucomicrobia bacterium]|nr:aminotransferase class III-fold pyridoxal phosphate-dependent enzyme [Verrucomicrobiota bacterium]